MVMMKKLINTFKTSKRIVTTAKKIILRSAKEQYNDMKIEDKVTNIRSEASIMYKSYIKFIQRDKRAYLDELYTKELHNIEHYNFLIEEIKKAEFRIIIFSGWISDKVIDYKFITLLEEALSKGANIYIVYGYKSNSSTDSMKNNTEAALFNLKILQENILAKKYSGKIYIYELSNHQKIFIIDDKFITVGSANWLSNRRYTNEEYSIVQYSKLYTEKKALDFIDLLKLKAKLIL